MNAWRSRVRDTGRAKVGSARVECRLWLGAREDESVGGRLVQPVIMTVQNTEQDENEREMKQSRTRSTSRQVDPRSDQMRSRRGTF